MNKHWECAGSITKARENSDGTLTVSGIASSEERDSQGEVVTAEAMRKAIPMFFASGPALREQHDPHRAIGKITSMEVDSGGATVIEGLVVDEQAILKIKHGVLRGFSIGGKVVRRSVDDPSIIERLRLHEVSAVDRPALESARITFFRADGTAVEPAMLRDMPIQAVRAGQDAGEPADGPPTGREHPTPTPRPGTATASKPEVPACAECGGPLGCPKCSTAAKVEAAGEVLKMSGLLAQRDDEVRKLASERDGLVAALKKAQAFATADRHRLLAVVAERARFEKRALAADAFEKRLGWAEGQLRDRPKGATRAMAIEKADDMAGKATNTGEPTEAEPASPMDLIKQAHGRPIRWGGQR